MIDLQELRQELLALTALRKRVVRENDPVGRLVASIRHDTESPPTWEHVDQALDALLTKVPGFRFLWLDEVQRYALVPAEQGEETTWWKP